MDWTSCINSWLKRFPGKIPTFSSEKDGCFPATTFLWMIIFLMGVFLRRSNQMENNHSWQFPRYTIRQSLRRRPGRETARQSIPFFGEVAIGEFRKLFNSIFTSYWSRPSGWWRWETELRVFRRLERQAGILCWYQVLYEVVFQVVSSEATTKTSFVRYRLMGVPFIKRASLWCGGWDFGIWLRLVFEIDFIMSTGSLDGRRSSLALTGARAFHSWFSSEMRE